ncbi:bicaudal-D-related protein 2-like [Spinachia spinachia]
MERAQSFSALNQRLRPQLPIEQVYTSLNKLEERQLSSLRIKSAPVRTTVLEGPGPKASERKPEDDSEREDPASNEGNCAGLSSNPIHITEANIHELIDDNRSLSSSEEEGHPTELPSEGSGLPSQTAASDAEGEGLLQSGRVNKTLPDLISSGKPLSRRRTLGHVSETLKEVRREVELSRKRSIRLKAQVDKLQESSDRPGWSQHRERVKEEVLSILGLLRPLIESRSRPHPKTSNRENGLDTSLAELQTVARELAIGHTKQFKSGKGKGPEESTILKQALRDRDEAMEKKKAMEAELLRSKTELMVLNNQLLEAVQKRLELALELETWKEDVQRILHQQLQSQQQAEQAQKKPSGLRTLIRNKEPVQRPSNFPLSRPVSPTTNPNQIFIPRAAVLAPPNPSPSPSSPRRWMDKLRRKKNGPDGGPSAAEPESEGKGFKVISLD